MNAPAEERVRLAASRLFPGAAPVVPMGGGANSRVFRLESASGPVVLKAYVRPTMDGASRLEVEFSALRLLEGFGIENVPKAMAADTELQVAAYGLIAGEPPDPFGAGEADVDELAGFILRLLDFRGRPECREVPPAAEARYSLAGVARNIRARLERLEEAVRAECGAEDDAEQYLEGLPMLREFLDHEFSPALSMVAENARLALGEAAFKAELPVYRRILSPSDFGLHNSLRMPGGRLAFVDFEYFGFDDPAKTVSDVCLHPAMNLSAPLRLRFAHAVLGRLEKDYGAWERFRAAMPLFGLKWCLILLNVFLPGHRPRAAGEAAALCRARLVKSRAMFARAMKASASPRPEMEDA